MHLRLFALPMSCDDVHSLTMILDDDTEVDFAFEREAVKCHGERVFIATFHVMRDRTTQKDISLMPRGIHDGRNGTHVRSGRLEDACGDLFVFENFGHPLFHVRYRQGQVWTEYITDETFSFLYGDEPKWVGHRMILYDAVVDVTDCFDDVVVENSPVTAAHDMLFHGWDVFNSGRDKILQVGMDNKLRMQHMRGTDRLKEVRGANDSLEIHGITRRGKNHTE